MEPLPREMRLSSLGENKKGNIWTGNWSVRRLQGDKRTKSHKSPWHTSFNKKVLSPAMFYAMNSLTFTSKFYPEPCRCFHLELDPLLTENKRIPLDCLVDWPIGMHVYFITCFNQTVPALCCARQGVLQFWMCEFSLIIHRINF